MSTSGISSVIIDSREPLWVQGLTFGGAPAMVSLLESSDLIAECADGHFIAVERKEAGDFLNTLKDDRLFPQIAGLRSITPWSYLVICGSLTPTADGKTAANYRETGWNWSAVQGALLTVQELGVHVVNVASDHDYEAAVIRLANRDRAAVRIEPARDSTIVGTGEQILASLPGVGADRAAELMRYCGSAAWALQYLTLDGWTVPEAPRGIGDGTKRRVRAGLGLDPSQVLAVVIRDTGQPITAALTAPTPTLETVGTAA